MLLVHLLQMQVWVAEEQEVGEVLQPYLLLLHLLLQQLYRFQFKVIQLLLVQEEQVVFILHLTTVLMELIQFFQQLHQQLVEVVLGDVVLLEVDHLVDQVVEQVGMVQHQHLVQEILLQ